jgi:hypothetical protein
MQAAGAFRRLINAGASANVQARISVSSDTAPISFN